MASRLTVDRPPVSMPPSERTAVLKRLEDLPPEVKTPELDQRRHFARCKQAMLLLREEFQAYFSGGQSFANTLKDKNDQAFLRAQRNRWLWLYTLLFDHFGLVEEQAKQLGFEIPASPGAYLIACLEEYSVGLYWEASLDATPEQARFSPSTSHKAYQEVNRLRPLFDKGCDALSKPERLKLDRFLEKYRPYATPTKVLLLQSFAEAVFFSNVKKDGNVRKLWKQYQIACDEVNSEVARSIHPQQGLPSHIWRKGVKRQL